ncbi:hypothetical protein AMECASPLE_027846 [Ameca splendens]|uniref:Uncharacterized protein n=1 Tax=Ameca splendens TaxID=208324 RepID=A0ABV0ZQ73_9TELE
MVLSILCAHSYNTQFGLAKLIGFEALLKTNVALGELLLLVLQLGLQGEVLFSKGSVVGQSLLLVLLDILHLQQTPNTCQRITPLHMGLCAHQSMKVQGRAAQYISWVTGIKHF